MELDAVFSGSWPANEELVEYANKAATAVEEVAPELANERLQVSLLFTDNKQIHALNREWRDRDKPTNVLSFPMLEREQLLALDSDGPPVMLGDIALAMETVGLEAIQKNILPEIHILHLIIHGLLHLAGHDHVHSDEEAEAMEALEIVALAKMGIPDPYGDRS